LKQPSKFLTHIGTFTNIGTYKQFGNELKIYLQSADISINSCGKMLVFHCVFDAEYY